MWYKLNEDKTFKKCDVFNSSIVILFTTETNDYKVSTIFLGIDHNSIKNNNDPILFETMVFFKGYKASDLQYRTRTYEQAKLIHNILVKNMKKKYEEK